MALASNRCWLPAVVNLRAMAEFHDSAAPSVLRVAGMAAWRALQLIQPSSDPDGRSANAGQKVAGVHARIERPMHATTSLERRASSTTAFRRFSASHSCFTLLNSIQLRHQALTGFLHHGRHRPSWRLAAHVRGRCCSRRSTWRRGVQAPTWLVTKLRTQHVTT